MIFPAVRQNLQIGFAACGSSMISVAVLSGGARIGFVDDVPALNRVEHLRSEVLRFHGSQTIRFLIIQGAEEAAGKSEGSEG